MDDSEDDNDQDHDDQISIYRKKLDKSTQRKSQKQKSEHMSVVGSEKKGSLENTMQLVGSEHDPLVQ